MTLPNNGLKSLLSLARGRVNPALSLKLLADSCPSRAGWKVGNQRYFLKVAVVIATMLPRSAAQGTRTQIGLSVQGRER